MGTPTSAKTAVELAEEARARIHEVSVDEVADEIERGDVVVIDVREPEEYQAGHIPGAVNVPRGMLEFRADPTTKYYDDRLARDRRAIVHCAVGLRGALATATLEDLGYEEVRNLRGGLEAWKEAGRPVE